ncbi:outer membrane protein TolC [Orenia metallireducens]|jgi:outer membrane protein TolC|uniref:Outer membrane protein TolC n=1 Tax=Orenia metallireducens TaxID=1413210 RepID=A0A285HD88_9FIRM|nr:TolC family protein [Orenia metallireducens]PRX27733.1 outer membrane protein TolC [Orenia metallireducens]SNY33709.1 Outer membrane protein TolC [Orenia metallireducens]
MKRKEAYILVIVLLFAFNAIASAHYIYVVDKEEAIEIALEQNSELNKLRKEIEGAEAQLREAEGAFYPTVDLGSGYTRFGEEQNGANDNYSVSLDLNQPIYQAGQLRSAYAIAKNTLEISKLELEQQKEELIYQVLEEYYNILKAKEILKVREQQVEQNKEYVEVAEVNKEVGINTKSDVLQARVSYNQAQQDLLVAKNNFETAKLALKNTLNMEDNVELEISDTLDWQEAEFKLEEAYEYALHNKTAFKLLDLQEENAKLNLKREKNSNLYPEVSLNAGYEASDDKLRVSDGEWRATLNLSYNLFNGGRDKEQETQLNKVLEKVQIDQKQTKKDLRLSLKSTLLNLRAAKDMIKLNELNLKQAQEDLENNELMFREGIISSLDLLDVQTTYQQVRTQYYQAIYDYNLAVAELNKVIGKNLAEVK